MAGRGRIRAADIATVRERAKIDEVVGEHLQLKRAGGGSLKGLCPFHDEKSPSFHVTPTRGLFHCLAGDTRVLTEDGAVPIRELAGRTVPVLTSNRVWVEAPFRSYGVQRLMRVQLSRNGRTKEIFATDQHRWFVRTNGTQGRRERVTADLRLGDRLVHNFTTSRIGHPRRSRPRRCGAGSRLRRRDPFRGGLDRGPLRREGRRTGALLRRLSFWTDDGVGTRFYGLPAHYKDERPVIQDDTSYLLGWLAGWFAADGCVAEDGDAILNSADPDDLEYARALCTRLGIGTFGVAKQSRVGIDGKLGDIYNLRLMTAELPESFFLLSHHRQRITRAAKKYARTHWVVKGVEWTDRFEEVFCAEVPAPTTSPSRTTSSPGTASVAARAATSSSSCRTSTT